MEVIMVCFTGFIIFAMFAIDHHLCKTREALNDIKILIELKKNYESENGQ